MDKLPQRIIAAHHESPAAPQALPSRHLLHLDLKHAGAASPMYAGTMRPNRGGFAAMLEFLTLVAVLGAGFLGGYITRFYLSYRHKPWCFLPNGKHYRRT